MCLLVNLQQINRSKNNSGTFFVACLPLICLPLFGSMIHVEYSDRTFVFIKDIYKSKNRYSYQIR